MLLDLQELAGKELSELVCISTHDVGNQIKGILSALWVEHKILVSAAHAVMSLSDRLNSRLILSLSIVSQAMEVRMEQEVTEEKADYILLPNEFFSTFAWIQSDASDEPD